MAGALKHKQRSQYRYHQNHQSNPYRQFHLNAARVSDQKNARAQGNFISNFFNKMRKVLEK